MTWPISGRANEEYEKSLIVERLLACWKLRPHMRLGQLLVNAANVPGNDIFHIEDYDLIDLVEKFTSPPEAANEPGQVPRPPTNPARLLIQPDYVLPPCSLW